MMIHLSTVSASPQSLYIYHAPGNRRVTFASASARNYVQGQPPRLSIFYRSGGGESREIDMVTLWVPHSWWVANGQSFCPDLVENDRLTVAITEGEVDMRLDMVEY